MTDKKTKIKKQQSEELSEIKEESIQPEISENAIEDSNIFVPDIPAQIEENAEYNFSTKDSYGVIELNPIKNDSDEILFLQHLLYRQHLGGFGKHLDDEINERIKQLRACL